MSPRQMGEGSALRVHFGRQPTASPMRRRPRARRGCLSRLAAGTAGSAFVASAMHLVVTVTT